jgi:hypothetical protein
VDRCEGRVHFTDKKPTSAAKVETLNTPRAQAPSGTVADAPPPAQSDDPVARQKKMADILSQERERNEAEADKKRKRSRSASEKMSGVAGLPAHGRRLPPL